MSIKTLKSAFDPSAKLIQTLLFRATGKAVSDPIERTDGVWPQAAPDGRNIAAEKTCLGYARSKGFASEDDLKQDAAALYRAPARLGLNQWSLAGEWKVGREHASLVGRSGAIACRFHARDLNLAMGPPPNGRWMWFLIKIDGAPPGVDHGADADADGWGRLDRPRLHQLVRQSRPVADRTFEIEFFGPGVRTCAFTFG